MSRGSLTAVVRPVGLLLGLALAGCGVAGSADDGTTGDGAEERLPAPTLTFDAATLELFADRRDDINLRATNVVHGHTFAVVDGTTLVAAENGPAGPAGSLQEGLLELHLDGALAVGEHRLELVTNDGNTTRRSEPVTLVIAGLPSDELPRLREQGVRGTVGPASHVFGRPRADATLLGLLRPDGAGGFEVGVVVRGENGWLAGSPLAGPAPGLRPDDLADRPATTVHDLVDLTLRTEAAEGLSYVLVWREGLAGTRVATRVLAATGAQPIATAFSIEQATSSPGQASRVEGVRFVGDDLAVAYVASLDAESPRPGDRQVATLRAESDDGFAYERRVSDPALIDVDALGEAVFVADPDPDRDRIGVRTHQARAAVLEHRDTFPAVVASSNEAFDQSADFPDDAQPPFVSRIAFLGALGSVSVVGVRANGDARLVQGSGLTGARRRVEIEPDDAASADPTGPASGAVMAGLVVVAVPHGDAAPVGVFVASGDQVRAHALDDLRCDELVLDASRRAQDDAVTDLACLRDGELSLHTVTLEP